MAQSNHTIKDVYDDIFKINDYFYETEQGQLMLDKTHGSIEDYCYYGNPPEKGNCHNDYLKMASSGVIHLLKNYKKYGLGHDKLAEYAILFLSYKLNQKSEYSDMKLSDFYTKYIVNNNSYNENINGDDGLTYKEIINRNNDLMNIKEISKFNYPFGMLLSLYYLVHLKNLDCKNCSKNANEFVQNFEDLNKYSNDEENSSYNKLLSTLSNDYDNLKNIFKNKCPNLQPLPELTPKKISVETSTPSHVQDNTHSSLQGSEVTSSSSSILNTVIPVLSTFAIPVFLVVSYKYSLFGFDKLFQRQYIRNKLKKVKNKMELNI
ncbi:CIR protein [Plasmodium chabaudi chabaudi]|uniref:CIR protein n=1 Tax=Plasmodium chabaudi chabaudi TaxID=31271 RepID=A0A4V0K060_PLACU|nr:CIR protein [Plasmodium chabaudi chabaudi]VTZ66332.1 CIR protein [Plasmodium chabaudi chabaudi]|eukprot:XP_016653047.1 CIR protein [Plasmodium chabaudi chabaudi]